MDGQRFDAITAAWATSRLARRTGLQLLAGSALGAMVAGFDLTKANNKKKGKGKGKGKNKKKPSECPGIRKRCGGECIPFLTCCHNGKPGCPPCHLCQNGGQTCEMKERPSCEPCKQPVCKDETFECVDKPIPICTVCQHNTCKDGAYQCVDTEGLTPCGPEGNHLCCDPDEGGLNEACCPAPPELGIPGNKFCVPRNPDCGNQDCKYVCGGVCCDTEQGCCNDGNGGVFCWPFGLPCP